MGFEYDRDRNEGLFELDHTRGSADVFVVLALDVVDRGNKASASGG